MQSDDQCRTPGRPYILGRKTGENKAIFFRPDCGQWSCPHCAQKRKSGWFLTAYKGTSELINNGHWVYMITVTSRGGKGRTKEKAMDAFKSGWPALRKRATYWQGEFEYILIPEQHKNGIMHVHILANNILTKRWWKDNAFACGLGYMVDTTRVESAGAGAWYVSKYIDKHLAYLQWPKGFRRIRTSAGWPRVKPPEGPDDTDYSVFNDYGLALWDIHLLRDMGVEVVDLVGDDTD